MGVGVLGDMFTAYVKPSLDGEVVLRKPTSNQTSARLKARQDKLADLKNKDTAPAKVAHKACSAAHKTVMKRVYTPGKGYESVEVCPIKEMKGFLKQALEAI